MYEKVHCCQFSRDNHKCLVQKSQKYAICAPHKILVNCSYNLVIYLGSFQTNLLKKLRLISNVFNQSTLTPTEIITTKLH